jgi:hypothetical protein
MRLSRNGLIIAKRAPFTLFSLFLDAIPVPAFFALCVH